MSSSRRKEKQPSKKKHPTYLPDDQWGEWSSWGWNETWRCESRVRQNALGELDYEYRPAPAPASTSTSTYTESSFADSRGRTSKYGYDTNVEGERDASIGPRPRSPSPPPRPPPKTTSSSAAALTAYASSSLPFGSPYSQYGELNTGTASWATDEHQEDVGEPKSDRHEHSGYQTINITVNGKLATGMYMHNAKWSFISEKFVDSLRLKKVALPRNESRFFHKPSKRQGREGKVINATKQVKVIVAIGQHQAQTLWACVAPRDKRLDSDIVLGMDIDDRNNQSDMPSSTLNTLPSAGEDHLSTLMSGVSMDPNSYPGQLAQPAISFSPDASLAPASYTGATSSGQEYYNHYTASLDLAQDISHYYPQAQSSDYISHDVPGEDNRATYAHDAGQESDSFSVYPTGGNTPH